MSYKEDMEYEIEMGQGLAALSNEGVCRCPNQAHIFHTNCWKGERCEYPHTAPPDYCSKCGGVIVSFQIIYVEDWRGMKSEL